MKVLIGEKEYRIEFEHGRHTFERGRDETDYTKCQIRDASSVPNIDGVLPVIALGWVARHYRDTPNREVARKQALKKALKDFDRAYHASDAALQGPLMDKGRRKLFWEAYLNRKPAIQAARATDP